MLKTGADAEKAKEAPSSTKNKDKQFSAGNQEKKEDPKKDPQKQVSPKNNEGG